MAETKALRPSSPEGAPAERTEGQRLLRRALLNLRRRPAALLGFLIVTLVLIAAIFAPVLAPHDPTDQTPEKVLRPPAWMEKGDPAYPLGTDHLGRDLASRLLYGARVSLLIGVAAVLISGGMGTALGLAAGFFRGRTDDAIMRLADIQLAFPFVLLALAVMAVLGAGLGKTVALLGITGWVIYGRVTRAEVLRLRELEFVQAARAMGNRDLAIIRRHVFPNVLPSLIVVATLQVPQVIITESALTFLGLGVPPAVVTWGGMLADARNYITTHWWIPTWPGLALQLTALGLNLVGDWLRDTLDPRLRV